MSFVVSNARLTGNLIKVAPSITTWSRLEVLPTTADLAPGLRTEVADALWLLHRQRAFGELRGEDAGSPIDVRVRAESAPLTRFHAGPPDRRPADDAVDSSHRSIPMEVVVEAEGIEDQHRLVAAAGQHFLRVLAAEGGSSVATRFTAAFPKRVEHPDDPITDPDGAAWAAVTEGRAIDALALADAVRSHRDVDGAVTAVPAQVTIPVAQSARVRRALTRWITWFDDAVTTPSSPSVATSSGERTSWQPDRQEYSFATAADLSTGRVTLKSSEYTDGQLDWHSFSAASSPDLGNPAGGSIAPTMVAPPSTLPSPVRYAGMPADRLWEFEDDAVNLGSLEAGPTDLGRLLLVEYGLVFGNDWFVVPLDLPVGSLCRIADMRVVDTFGVETEISATRNRSGAAWEMFELTAPGRSQSLQDLFLLPPAITRRLEGDAVEEIRLLRDESANIAWAIEHTVAGASGRARERGLEASRRAVHQRLDADPGDAALIYRLQTSVPVHWIPFTAVAAAPVTDPGFDIKLERRALVRTLADGSTEEIHPSGRLLRTDPTQPVDSETPLRLHEEEVPRDGAIVTRSFQYCRWLDGRSYLWMGRSKRTGRGEGSSALRFDSSLPPS